MKTRSIAKALAITLVTWSAAVTPLAAGHYLEQRVTSSDAGMNMEVRAWSDGDHGRVEFASSDSEYLPRGSYLLTRDRGHTVFLIDPAKRTYAVWDIDALFATLGQVLDSAQGIVELDFSDVEAEDLGDEAGGTLLGHATTKKTWRTAYTMDMKVMFMKQSHRMDTTTEAWLTHRPAHAALSMWFTVRPPTTGDPDLDRVLTQSMERIDGMPLKVVQRSTMTDNKKKGRAGKTTTTTMEITALREQAVDAALFVMPDDYSEVPLMPALTAGKEKEDRGLLKGLGGLLGRRKNRGR